MTVYKSLHAYQQQRLMNLDQARCHLRGAKDARRHLEYGLARQHLILAGRYRKLAGYYSNQIRFLTELMEA